MLLQIKVFIASPSDLAVERRAFKDTVDSLNRGFGKGADVEFVPLGWEDALSQVGRRPQSVINDDIDVCDVFILVMWRRWGQEAPDAGHYSSYTEEEFYRALARFEKTGSPCIYVFFKHVDAGQIADPGEQLKRVLAFHKKLEQSRQVLYRKFTDATEFPYEIEQHLCAFAKQAPSQPGPRDEAPIVPDGVKAEIDRYKSEATKALEELEMLKKAADAAVIAAEQARAEAKSANERAERAEAAAQAHATVDALGLAEFAARAALDGRIEEARQTFAKAIDGTTNVRILELGFEFFRRIGEIDEAQRLAERCLAIGGRSQLTATTAAALCNLGLVAQSRGNLKAAEELYQEALAMNRKLGRSLGIVHVLGSLASINLERRELGAAEKILQEALEIDGRLERYDGIAQHLGNLGLIARELGNLDGAEKLHQRALEIARRLRLGEAQACQLGNLGIVASIRHDFDAAENYHYESLEIERKLGRLEGQAGDLGNLAAVALQRGNTDDARRLLTESREIFARIGMQQAAVRAQGLIDSLSSA